MSSMLRLARRLNLGRAERRLGSALHREVVPEAAAAARCLTAANLDRNYVTRAAAVTLDFTGHNFINQKLSEMDSRIKSFNNIYKKDVEEILQIVAKKGQINSSQALLLIRCCGEFLFNESAKTRRSLVNEIWKLLKDLEVNLDVSHYNAFLLVNLENEVDFSPLDILLEMKDKGIQPNRVTFQRLIEQYCNKGDIAGATKILEHMNQQEIPINENIFITLMKGHSNTGDTANALKLLDVMKQAGIEPSPQAYGAVMYVHAKTGDVDSIMKVLNDCKEKDILLSCKEILDVIYTLTINNYSEHVDKFIDIMPKGATYNKTAILIIYKLLEKEHDEVAYKLLKSLTKSKFQTESDAGHFFIRKLVAIGSDTEKVIKYCKLMKEENLNSAALKTAIHAAYINKFHHMAFPLLKELKESGDEIREQYFYPILANYSKADNLQDLLGSVKIIANDFKVNLGVNAVKDYIVPNLSGNYLRAAEKLSANGLSFIVTAHAIVIHLLENEKLVEALNIMHKTNMWFRFKLLSPHLIDAFVKTKDVESFVNILHFLYVKSLENTGKTDNEEPSKTGNEEPSKTETEEQSKTENTEQSSNSLEFVSDIVVQAIQQISTNDVNLVEVILQRLLEKGVNINETAVTKIKQHLGQKLNSKSEEILSKLVSDTFELTPIMSDNRRSGTFSSRLNYLKEKSKEFSEFKMLLIQEHAKIMNIHEVEKLLKELEEQNPTYTVGFCTSLFDYYSKTGNIIEADKWYNRLHEINPDCRIDRTKILHYARSLIQNKRPTDALKVLEHPVTDESAERNELSAKLFTDVLHNCPEYMEDFFNVLKRHGYFVKISTGVLGPLIKVHLMAGDVDKAIEKFKWCCETYNFAPMRRQIMKELIVREDAKALQYVTDLVTRIQDEIQALHDLAYAFFECDRPRQARKILETPGLRLRIQSILMAAEMYSESNDVEKLENFLKLFKGLYIDLNPLYCLLLKSYENKKDWEKCLALWTQMQEDNIQPSSKFMIELDRILKKFNQTVPFTVSQKSSEISKEFHNALVQKDLEKAAEVVNKLPKREKPSYLLQLIQALAGENNTAKAVQYIHELIDITKTVEQEYFDAFSSVLIQLVKKDDFSTIVNLLKRIQEVSRKQKAKSIDRTIGYFGVVNEVYLESGQFSKFLDHLHNLLDQYENNVENESFLNPIIVTVLLKGLIQNPELEDRFKEYAIKAVKYKYYKPISALWSHQLVQDSPEAEKTWNEYLSETPNIYPISAVLVCIERKAFEKIPLIVEKVQQVKGISFFDKRKMFAAILKTLLDTDFPQKYDIAFECLRHASKVVDIHNFNDKIIQEIQENVTNGQTIESLKAENERTKTQVTG